MRKAIYILVPVLVASFALLLPLTSAQAPDTGEKKDQPKEYIVVSPAELEQSPGAFRDRNVQVADYYDQAIDQIPRDIRRMGYASENYWAFRTTRFNGSNMLCLVDRQIKEAQPFFETPLVEQTPIYLFGTVGRQVVLQDGITTICVVDKVIRGHTPPVEKAAEKKPLVFTMEWVIVRPDGTSQIQKQEYKIPEPGRYEIPDPYERSKKLYMTFQF